MEGMLRRRHHEKDPPKSYIMFKSGNLDFFVGKKYIRLLKTVIEEVEKMREDGIS